MKGNTRSKTLIAHRSWPQLAPRILFASFIAILSLSFSGCSNAGRYHVKLTIDAVVGGVKYHGEGVQKYLCHRAYKAMNDLNQCTVLGEAIPLMSADHRYVFVILRAANGRDPTEMASKILVANGQAPFAPRTVGLPRQWDLAPSDVPMIVRFGDLSNPRSIELVGASPYPEVTPIELDNISASAELTDENVTTGRIEKILPWISKPFYKNKLVGNVGVEESRGYFFASIISREMFKTGE